MRNTLPASLAALALCSTVFVPAASALSCGDTITSNTTLTADLGPCSEVALTIGANNLSLNLNGFSILAVPGAIEGIEMSTTTNVTVKGPGTISGFLLGINASDVDGAKIRRVHFTDNSAVGLLLGRVAGSTLPSKITSNTFDGNRCMGILITDFNDVTNGVQILSNTITGSSAATDDATCDSQIGGGVGIWTTAYGVIVKQNTLTGNTNGLFADGYSYGLVVNGNDISGNTQDGLASEASSTVVGNMVNGNGRDGISLTGSESLIQNNTANDNLRRGIGVGDVIGVGSGVDIQVTNNRALGNGTDLYWDGLGSGDCWKRNDFDTSSGTLPTCP